MQSACACANAIVTRAKQKSQQTYQINSTPTVYTECKVQSLVIVNKTVPPHYFCYSKEKYGENECATLEVCLHVKLERLKKDEREKERRSL